METTKIYEVTFDTEERILAANLSKPDEVVMLFSEGRVIRYNLARHEGTYLFSEKADVHSSSEYIDLESPVSIYTMDEIVVVVNDYKTRGRVYYPGKYRALSLWREDYRANISTYPIALYKNEAGVPHLIYAEAWNHVQIMNLDTRQVLTAAKSLIEENAEEKHLQFYKQHSEDNKLAWPSPYDYFYGKLFLAPDQKHFLSAGWVWGSADCYNVYNIEKFITSNRISAKVVAAWEHERRSVCWIDNETVAVLYDPHHEGDTNTTPESPCEIHCHWISNDDYTPEQKILLPDRVLVRSTLYFNQKRRQFILIHEAQGLIVLDLDGRIVYQDPTLGTAVYMPDIDRFLAASGKTICVYELT